MRTSPEYRAAIADLAEDASTAPSYDVENCATAISCAYGVSVDDVNADLDAALQAS
jgi:hypothetical protein